MRIHAVALSLDRGGAERVLLGLCDAWRQRGHQVTVFTRKVSDKAEYPLPESVQRKVFSSGPSRPPLLPGIPKPGFLRRLRAIRRQLFADNPDVIVVFGVQAAVRILFFTWGAKTPVVVSERNNPAAKRVSFSFRILRRLLYPCAAKVVLVSGDMRRYFPWLPDARIVVIHNPAPGLAFGERESKSSRTATLELVAMGRLVPQKGFDLLLSALADVRSELLPFRLTVLGEGPQRAALERQAAELELTQLVDFRGVVTDPTTVLCESDLFVLSSRFEGFPNALLEALACGLPLISFNCPTGPREIVRDGENGILVPAEDVQALGQALVTLQSDPDRREALAQRARSSLSRFDREQIVSHWERLFESVAEARGVKKAV